MHVLLCSFFTLIILSLGSTCPIVQRDFTSGYDLTEFENDLTNSFDDDAFNPATSTRLAKVNSGGSSINSPVRDEPTGYLATSTKNEKPGEASKGEGSWPEFKMPDLPPRIQCNQDEENLCCVGPYDETRGHVFDCSKCK